MAMKFGAEPKKLAILGALGLVLVYVWVSGSSDTSTPQQSVRPAPLPAVAPPAAAARPQPVTQPRRNSGERVLAEFRPSLKARRPEDRPDPMSIDPTLKTGILAKLQTVNVTGTRRSLFEFGNAPPPPVDPKIVAAAKKPVQNPLIGPMPAPASTTPAAPPPPPPPPPIPLKFFGYVANASQQAGPKRAFFLDGEDIHVVNEGDTVKKRYKIVRIGVNTVTVEDTQYKNTQTLPLEEQPAA